MGYWNVAFIRKLFKSLPNLQVINYNVAFCKRLILDGQGAISNYTKKFIKQFDVLGNFDLLPVMFLTLLTPNSIMRFKLLFRF